MTTAHTFDGPDGMARKIRLLASNCEAATAGLSRTLLIAAVPLLVVALPLTLVQELLYALPGPAFYVVLLAALYALRRARRPDAAPAKRKAKRG